MAYPITQLAAELEIELSEGLKSIHFTIISDNVTDWARDKVLERLGVPEGTLAELCDNAEVVDTLAEVVEVKTVVCIEPSSLERLKALIDNR